jgi:hypothetical protein
VSSPGVFRSTRSCRRLVRSISRIPTREKVEALKTLFTSSGLVRAWEKASTATIVPITVGSAECGRTSSAKSPTYSSTSSTDRYRSASAAATRGSVEKSRKDRRRG